MRPDESVWAWPSRRPSGIDPTVKAIALATIAFSSAYFVSDAIGVVCRPRGADTPHPRAPRRSDTPR